MGSVSRRGGAVLAFFLLAGCGSLEDGGAEADSTSADQESTVTLPPRLEGVESVDLSRALRVGCVGWSFEENRDSAAINDTVYDLLVGDINLAPTRNQVAIDEAVRRACDESDGDPALAIGILTDELDFDEGELDSMVDDACRRYGRGREAPDPEFDSLIAMVLGVNDDQLAALVLHICGDEVFVVEPEPQILPDPSLTPGQASSGDALDTGCGEGFAETVHPPGPSVVDVVLTSYAVAPEDAAGVAVLRLIPASLGGTDDPANLFPVQIDAHPGAADKLLVDERMTEVVCAGEVDLTSARAAIVSNWPGAFLAVSEPLAPPVTIGERLSTDEDSG